MKRVLAAVLVLTMALSLGAVTALAAPEDLTYSFEETVLLDNESAKVTATAFDASNYNMISLTLLLENKTDKELHFGVLDTYLNGRKCDGYIGSSDVPAGESVYCDLSWNGDDMAEVGVIYIDTVMAEFWVYNSDDINDTVFDDTVTVSLGASSATPALSDLQFESEMEESELVSDGYNFTIKAYDSDGLEDNGMPTLVIYLENNTDERVLFTAENVTVNGVECGPYWSEDMEGGTSLYSFDFCWTQEELEEAGIDSIEQVEFELAILSNEDETMMEELGRWLVTLDMTDE